MSEVATVEVQQEQQQQAPVFTKTTFSAAPAVVEIQEQVPPATEVGQETPATEAAPAETVVVEENVASFSMPSFGNDTETTETIVTEADPKANTVSWKEAIKTADRKELLKEVGLDDFDIEFIEYRKQGNDPYKYLEAKAFDWTKVSDVDVVKNEYQKQYPNLNAEQIERLINNEFKQHDNADEQEREDGAIMLQAKAYNLRQQRIEEQKKFQIPTVTTQQEANTLQASLEQKQIEEQQRQQYDAYMKFVNEHPSTKSLLEGKRVTVNLGEGVNPFNFNVDNPEMLQSVAFGKNWVRAIAENPGEPDESKLIPDVAKLQKIALVALNPNYEKDIFNYGKSMGLKAIVEEGQNARRPHGQSPTVVPQTPKEAWGSAKSTTFGGN